MTKPFDDSVEAHRRRSEAAKRAVATKRKKYRTWPTRKNDHLVCQTMLNFQRGESLVIYRCEDTGSHRRHHCQTPEGPVFWSVNNSPAEALREKKRLVSAPMTVTHNVKAEPATTMKQKEKLMTTMMTETAAQDSVKVTLADFSIEAVLIHDEKDENNNRWKVTVRDTFADAKGSQKEGTKFIDNQMFGWLMAVMVGGDDCDIGAPLYAKLEEIFADGTLPRCIP